MNVDFDLQRFDTIYNYTNYKRVDGTTTADSIYVYGSNVTADGGTGNDFIADLGISNRTYGGAGNDTFIYKPGEGKDTIMDYASGDMIQIPGGTLSKSSFSRNTLTLTVGSGSLTLKNVTSSTNFNINGSTYHVSGSKLTK